MIFLGLSSPGRLGEFFAQALAPPRQDRGPRASRAPPRRRSRRSKALFPELVLGVKILLLGQKLARGSARSYPDLMTMYCSK